MVNCDDDAKVGLLRACLIDTRPRLFKVDIYNPDEFEQAFKGVSLFSMLPPPCNTLRTLRFYKNTAEAAVAGAKSIAVSCINSATVRRVIYTASVVAAAPLKDDETGFKDSMDESCWTPLNLPFSHEILSHGENKTGGLEVVSLAYGLVGGETLLPYTPESVDLFISQLTDHENRYQALKFLEELLGKVPIIHIDNVCEAHIFCIEKPSINGRFLCASLCISSAKITNY
ncbi:hypothetical protein AAG906_005145 [Vitis piasezkii]